MDATRAKAARTSYRTRRVHRSTSTIHRTLTRLGESPGPRSRPELRSVSRRTVETSRNALSSCFAPSEPSKTFVWCSPRAGTSPPGIARAGGFSRWRVASMPQLRTSRSKPAPRGERSHRPVDGTQISHHASMPARAAPPTARALSGSASRVVAPARGPGAGSRARHGGVSAPGAETPLM